ncbi:MAG: ferric reductase-like transmembrane domain-containing protein [Phycisphaerae bacterium]|nr:ferric reductase-like transmembrane domain-containing protein [Phycisphaerae bacterium]
MSVGYSAVQWNRHKRVYDACVGGAILLFLASFVIASRLLEAPPSQTSPEILVMRALGACGYVMLHIVLCIGPLARLDRRLLPLLYNRRHFGVLTFLMGLAHGGLALVYYHGFSATNPLLSLLTSNINFDSLRAFPFQLLGAAALFILFLMAATSHDFWLKFLGAAAWKRLHMLVYAAYALLLMHVALGFLQTQRGELATVLIAAGAVCVVGLHLAAGLREYSREIAAQRALPPSDDSWVDVGSPDELEESRGATVSIGNGERIALFRHQGCISAISNVCAHQGGPLGEGRIIDGCVTCPWHGWQYRPADGQSPPPFTEKLPTYRVRISKGRIQVFPTPLPPGTAVEPAKIEESAR